VRSPFLFPFGSLWLFFFSITSLFAPFEFDFILFAASDIFVLSE